MVFDLFIVEKLLSITKYNFCAVFLDPPKTAIDDITADDFRRLLDINLVSYFLFAKVSMSGVESNITGNQSEQQEEHDFLIKQVHFISAFDCICNNVNWHCLSEKLQVAWRIPGIL